MWGWDTCRVSCPERIFFRGGDLCRKGRFLSFFVGDFFGGGGNRGFRGI